MSAENVELIEVREFRTLSEALDALGVAVGD